MQMKELQAVYRHQPFRPFVMHLADGRKVRVAHPEFMAVSPAGRSAVVYDKTGGFEVIDLLLVTSIEVRNGASRSRKSSK